jgi:hypothetical protein
VGPAVGLLQLHLVELLQEILGELDVVGDAVDGRVVQRGDGLEGCRDTGVVRGEVDEAVAALAVRALWRTGAEEMKRSKEGG